jgi:hypothetical protein
MTLDNFVLLELILLLDYIKVPITCRLSKKEIVHMIQEKQIKFEEKKVNKLPTMWEVVDIRYGDVAIKIYGMGTDSFEFMDGDIIQFPDGNEYYINNMEYDHDDDEYETITMYFSDKNFQNEFVMDVNDFMCMIDNDDVTIVKSHTRQYKKLM